jgi:hypothetical protein
VTSWVDKRVILAAAAVPTVGAALPFPGRPACCLACREEVWATWLSAFDVRLGLASCEVLVHACGRGRRMREGVS